MVPASVGPVQPLEYNKQLLELSKSNQTHYVSSRHLTLQRCSFDDVTVINEVESSDPEVPHSVSTNVYAGASGL